MELIRKYKQGNLTTADVRTLNSMYERVENTKKL